MVLLGWISFAQLKRPTVSGNKLAGLALILFNKKT